MPRYDIAFNDAVDDIIAIARAGEIVRASAARGTVAFRELYPSRLEALYELAYLRVFIEWEIFLESSFLRYTCGYRSRVGLFARTGGLPYHSTLADANIALLGGNDYVLWYPKKTIPRAKQHLVSCPHETVISSARATLDNFLAIRHRIAHGQPDAKTKFDRATMDLNHRRYGGARPGRFLRDWDEGPLPAVRWLDSIASQLKGIAGLIV